MCAPGAFKPVLHPRYRLLYRNKGDNFDIEMGFDSRDEAYRFKQSIEKDVDFVSQPEISFEKD